MGTIEKLKILSNDSQYDLACACGTGKDDRRRRGLDGKWLYPVTLPNGGYSILLKTLLSNVCSNDCKYCPLRSETNVRRCTLQPDEVANIFMEYVRRKKVFGLFLSSGVIRDPDYTMDRINAAARILRYKHNYKGYIHLKVIPGASDAAIEDSISLASAVSLNIETPGKKHFDILSTKKDYINDIVRPLKLMSKLTAQGMKYSRVKCTTQFIVGASDETDSEIIQYMFKLYNHLKFQRVYFSAYQKGLGHPDIPGEKQILSNPNNIFMREHRLYQSDYLIRKYGFSYDDILFDPFGNLRLDKDPKDVWAERHPEFFPVKLNSADREELLRVPGIGIKTAEIILKTRRARKISSFEDLGIKGKRAEKVRKYVIFE
ncbi:putative DNA modification/repair radical SAM protein [Dissulfurispira thermophila]|uniref:Putative DNA modification/repair radical SAM protein n=2 Tax=root TaxID=1 RepID=A0A7G1H2X3_9BACT|nr:radical SAM protein [Dissulfurispira thermophila]BCB97154.1 putative DNA modification/repair radical SAM protein [Dissulfurispira thermophila]